MICIITLYANRASIIANICVYTTHYRDTLTAIAYIVGVSAVACVISRVTCHRKLVALLQERITLTIRQSLGRVLLLQRRGCRLGRLRGSGGRSRFRRGGSYFLLVYRWGSGLFLFYRLGGFLLFYRRGRRGFLCLNRGWSDYIYRRRSVYRDFRIFKNWRIKWAFQFWSGM